MSLIEVLGDYISRLLDGFRIWLFFLLEIMPPVSSEHVDGMPSAEVLDKMIAESAYYRAKLRNFQGDYEITDWLEAEAEILNRFS